MHNIIIIIIFDEHFITSISNPNSLIMLPTKEGHIVKFHTPFEDEDPDQLYVVVGIHLDVDRPRAKIQALSSGMAFPSISINEVNDLEEVKVDTSELIGLLVTINRADYSQAYGKVLAVSEQKINLDLAKKINGVETNVWLTVEDDHGVVHHGYLYVAP